MAPQNSKYEGDSVRSARHTPRQTRSRATVSYIKEATLELLSKDGIDACSTEKIAQRAGVSIGSVYKYFRNRDAILISLYEDAHSEYTKTMTRLTSTIFEKPIREGIAFTIKNILSALEQNQMILLQLNRDMPELHLQERGEAMVNLGRNNIRVYMHYKNPSLNDTQLEHRSFYIERMAFSCIETFLQDPPKNLSKKRMINDLSKLISHIMTEPSDLPP